MTEPAESAYEEMFDIEKEAERSGAGVVDDPYPVWAELLAEGPVQRGPIGELMGLPLGIGNLHLPGFQYVSIFGFAAVSQAFTRPDDFGTGFHQDLGIAFSQSILAMEGTTHRRYRSVVQERFQPAVVRSWWRDKIAALVEELVAEFEGSQRVDLNSRFFAQLPLRTVTAGFGMSPGEGQEFRHNVWIGISATATPEEKAAALGRSDEILERVIAARRQEPQDDVISHLATAELEDEDGSMRPFTVQEIVDFCRLIVFAGGGTTWKQLGITLFALLNDREQLEAVKSDRSLVPQAVLESARWYPNDPLFFRKALRDTTLEGVEIPKGTVLHLCLGAANRDPARWEDPEHYDVFRPVQRSVAFGAGPHSCLGQHVARQEMEAALNALLDRFPELCWDPDQPPPRLSGSLISRGPGPLPVLLK